MNRTRLMVPAVLLVFLLGFGTVGCGTDSYQRRAEVTHWHDEDTVILVYTRQQTSGTFLSLFRPEPETMHVRICKIQDDNTMKCRHQRDVTNILNPHVVHDQNLDDRWTNF